MLLLLGNSLNLKIKALAMCALPLLVKSGGYF